MAKNEQSREANQPIWFDGKSINEQGQSLRTYVPATRSEINPASLPVRTYTVKRP